MTVTKHHGPSGTPNWWDITDGDRFVARCDYEAPARLVAEAREMLEMLMLISAPDHDDPDCYWCLAGIDSGDSHSSDCRFAALLKRLEVTG